MGNTAAASSRLRSDEDGIALLLAMLVLFVVAVGLASTIAYSTNQSQSVAHDAAHVDTVGLAESGLNYAAAILTNPANDPTSSSTLPSSSSPGSVALGAGTAYYWGNYNSSTMTWTLYGKGSVRNPTATQTLTHVESEQFAVTQGGASGGAWGYMFAYSPTGCFAVPNSVVINQPLYVNGNLCVTGAGKITSAASSVSVAGTIQTSSSSTMVGTSSSPIPQLHVGGGCRLGGSGSFVTPCTSAQYVYATSQDSTVQTIPKPTLDLPNWYANAQPGPSHACTSGSFPGGFDNNSSLDRSLPAVNLMPATSYDCTVTSGGQTVGRIAWSPGVPGALTIQGTIFFDGTIVINGNEQGVYSGRGTIYASGTISMANSGTLCTKYTSGACDFTNWDASTNMLVLVAGSTTTPDFTTTGNARFQGGIYANTDYTQGNSVKQEGPIVANGISLSGAALGEPSGGTIPSGAPGGGFTVAVVPNTWNG